MDRGDVPLVWRQRLMLAASLPRRPARRRRHRDKAVALAGVVTIAGTIIAMALWYAGLSSFEGDSGGRRVAGPVAGDELEPAAPPIADPASVAVASRGIEADTIPLGKHDDGSLEVPESAHTAGWWTGGAVPGERGAAVIVGHVDSRDGPGAFFGLADVEPDERVTVRRADGSSVHFRVERVETHPKTAFPTEAVYGHTDAPRLRLVTCAGAFDRTARRYEDNLIVFAALERGAVHGSNAPLEAGGSDRPAPSAASAASPAPAGSPDSRGAPIGLAALGVVGTAAAVTGQALRSNAEPADAPAQTSRG